METCPAFLSFDGGETIMPNFFIAPKMASHRNLSGAVLSPSYEEPVEGATNRLRKWRLCPLLAPTANSLSVAVLFRQIGEDANQGGRSSTR